MSELPLVSIIVSSYNHEDYVGDCIKSVLAQTYRNIEFVLFDDCSTDATYEIAEQYRRALEDRFLSVDMRRNEDNGGLTKNLNAMIRVCHGKYVKMIASDDFMLPTCIEHLVEFMELHEEFDSAVSNVAMIRHTGHFPLDVSDVMRLGYDSPPLHGRHLEKTLFEEGDHILVAGRIDRLETYCRYGLFDESIRIEDWEFWLRFTLEGGSLGYLGEVTMAYRITPNSLSHFAGSAEGIEKFRCVFMDEIAILEKYKDKMPSNVNRGRGWQTLLSRRLKNAMEIHADEMIQVICDVAKRKRVTFTPKAKIGHVLYRLNMYDFFYLIWNKFHSRDNRAKNVEINY